VLNEKTLGGFLEEVAAGSAAPGGGSVAAIAAALGAALTSMTCRLTVGKKRYLEVQGEMEAALISSERLRAEAVRLAEEDAAAFGSVMAALAMPTDSEDQRIERRAALQAATLAATQAPLRVLRLAVQGLQLAQAAAEKGNQNCLSDVGVAALMLQAAAIGAVYNVRINLTEIDDQDAVGRFGKEAAEVGEQANRLAKQTSTLIEARLA
jgi:glutamate formiminotransferase/formiminotetrahydrofolate cyclodeaminase